MSLRTEGLDDVYGARSPEQSKALYDQWSGTYDADNLAKGFRLPFVAAGCLARHLGLSQQPILDAGCGTGLVGEMLHLMGYGPISGCDLSAQMVLEAQKTGAYSALLEADMGQSLPFEDGHFGAFVCTGSFGPGHAPPSTLQHLTRVTQRGGIGVFNVIEETWIDQGFGEVLDQMVADKHWEILQEIPNFRCFLVGEPDLLVRMFVLRIL